MSPMSERPDLTVIDEMHVLVTPQRKPSDHRFGFLKNETYAVADEMLQERRAQNVKWGEQNHPDGTGWMAYFSSVADDAKARTDAHAKAGTLTWHDILDEEVAEAFAEYDPRKLRTELIQVAAVASAWVEAIDRRDDS